MTDIVQMSKGGTKLYPQTHVQAVLGLPDFSSFQKASDVQTAITNAISPLQTQVDNSAVGTNLLMNTSDFSSNWTGMSSVSTTTEYNGYPSMVFNSSSEQVARQNFYLGKLQNSTKYTASFWAKADNAGDKAHTELLGGIGKTDFVLTTNWVRYTATVTSVFDANTNTDHSKYFVGVSTVNKGNVYIALPKLELGSNATDYSLNPQDIATDGSVQTAITNALGKVATINVISQADYDKLADKTGVYFIEG